MFKKSLQPPIRAPLDSILGNDNDHPPSWKDVIFYSENLQDSVGVSFTGTTMTLGPECPFLGIGPFVDGSVYDLSTFQLETVRQILYANSILIIYSTPQDDLTTRRIFRFLRSSLSQRYTNIDHYTNFREHYI